MNASKQLINSIRQKQEEIPGLSHEDAYAMIRVENPKMTEAFLKEFGIGTDASVAPFNEVAN